ncbi:hypothetical protein [Streptomyces olivochromogenes]|uniref:hypothetical protein n=1 Tax=Streptomyces olivochromogenes TaxID=1963 RepID=UPI001F415859|nr:hypothetical protein [Streptomyces olivochromogenes]MCF3131003.1 hypothetical protein [Streptomyces olivochromogenes]
MATRLGPAAEADLTTAATTAAIPASAGTTATSAATAPPVRLWLQPAVIALVVVAAFVGCYVGLQRNPQPHRVPVAVAGQKLSGEIRQVLGDTVDVHRVADAATGRAEVERRDVVAALSRGAGSDRLRLQVGGANGQSTTTAVKSLIGAYAHGSDQRLTTVDVVPLARFDARGLAGFYVAFGVTLAGFVLAQNALGLANHLHLRHRFWLLSGVSVAIGIIATVIAGPVLGAVPAPVMPLAFALSLLAAAAAFTTKLLGTYLGPVGVPVATLLLLTVGNSTSGAAIGPDLLPSAARAVSALLPPGAAVRAVTDLSYFHGAQAVQPLATLALWAAIAAVLVSLRPRLGRRRRRAEA